MLRGLLIALGLAILTGAVLSAKSLLSVKNVECHLLSGQQCSPELVETLQALQGKSMLFEDYASAGANSPSTKQPVTLVAIKKKLPSTVIVTFKHEAAEYVLVEPDQTSIISETAKAFTGEYNTDGLLFVQSDQNLISENGYIEPDVHHTIMTIKQTAKEIQLPLTGFHWVDKSTIKLSMENREEQFIVDSESPRLQLHTISLILKSNEYRDISEKKTELDLRFNMPVLRTQP